MTSIRRVKNESLANYARLCVFITNTNKLGRYSFFKTLYYRPQLNCNSIWLGKTRRINLNNAGNTPTF